MSARATPAVSLGVTLPYSTSSSRIGCASTIRPKVAGTFSMSIMRSACDTESRTPLVSSAAA